MVLGVTSLQIGCAYLLRSTPIFSWPFFLTAYIVGATANQNTFLAIHEISHNLAFRSAYANRLFAIFANLPIGLPYSAAFRPYHLTHHKALGVDGLDTDLPTKFEAIFLDSVLGKAFFCTFQILFYALRPMMVLTLPFTGLHFLNLVVQLGFDAILVWSCGWNSFAYLIMSSFLAGSLHPCAGHFIAEHVGFSYLLPETPDSLGKGKILNQTYITNLFSMSSRNLSTHLPKMLFLGRQCQLKLTPIMAVWTFSLTMLVYTTSTTISLPFHGLGSQSYVKSPANSTSPFLPTPVGHGWFGNLFGTATFPSGQESRENNNWKAGKWLRQIGRKKS